MRNILLALVLLFAGFAMAEDSGTRFSRALALQEAGDYPAALEEYEAVISIRGEDAAVRHNMALVYLAMGQGADARREAERAVVLAPREGRYRVTLGAILLTGERQDLKAAERHLRRAVRILSWKDDKAGLAAAWYNLGVIAQRRFRFKEARECYQAALAADSTDESTLTALESLPPNEDSGSH